MKKNKREHKIKALYDLLKKLERENTPFSIKDILQEIDWQESTIKTYLSKKLRNLVSLNENGLYTVESSIKKYDFSAFKNLMSQVQSNNEDPFKPKLNENVKILVDKAKESALLAVEIYNKPQTMFRTHGYTVLMIISWTSALHAYFEKNNTDYFYKEKNGSYKIVNNEKKAWELGMCIKKCNDIPLAAKKNIDLFIELRNKIEHRYCPSFDLETIGECHALLENFEKFLTKQFGTYYSLQQSLMIPLQLIKTREKDIIKSLKGVQKEHYDKLTDFLHSFRESLSEETLRDPAFCFRIFLIPNLSNHLTSADKAIQFVNENDLTEDQKKVLKNITVINKIKTREVKNAGKFKPKDIVNSVNQSIDKDFTMSMHTNCWKYYNVRPTKDSLDPANTNTKYCQYDEVNRDYVYTKEWADFLVSKLKNNAEYQKIKNLKKKP